MQPQTYLSFSKPQSLRDQVMQATTEKKISITRDEALKILANVPYEKGFHFFTTVGKYTGETAINLFSLYEELKTVEPGSVKFHLQRRDFQNWIHGTLGDNVLAERLDKVNVNMPEQDLKQEIRKIVSARIQELRKTV